MAQRPPGGRDISTTSPWRSLFPIQLTELHLAPDTPWTRIRIPRLPKHPTHIPVHIRGGVYGASTPRWRFELELPLDAAEGIEAWAGYELVWLALCSTCTSRTSAWSTTSTGSTRPTRNIGGIADTDTGQGLRVQIWHGWALYGTDPPVMAEVSWRPGRGWWPSYRPLRPPGTPDRRAVQAIKLLARRPPRPLQQCRTAQGPSQTPAPRPRRRRRRRRNDMTASPTNSRSPCWVQSGTSSHARAGHHELVRAGFGGIKGLRRWLAEHPED